MKQDITSTRAQTISQMVLAVVAVMFSIYWLRPVLVPLVVALFVVSGVSPILNTLEKRLGVTRIVAAALTFLAGVLMLLLFGFAIWVSMRDLATNGEDYRKRVRDLVSRVEKKIADTLPTRKGESTDPNKEDSPAEPEETSPLIEDANNQSLPLGGQPQTAVAEIDDPSTQIALPESRDKNSAATAPDSQTKSDEETDDKASQFVDAFVRDGITVVSQALFNLVSTSIVVLIYVFFLLIGSPSVKNPSPTLREIDHQVRSYLALKTIISIVTGFAFGLALRLFGVPMAFTFGVMAFLLNFVPNVGPLAASVLPIPLIIFDPTGTIGWMIAVISVTCMIQVISGNLVEPRIMGNSSDLHPVTILVALMFWGMMWGVIGMFLAVPITSAIKIVLQRLETTKPIADLMAGRWGEEPETSVVA